MNMYSKDPENPGPVPFEETQGYRIPRTFVDFMMKVSLEEHMDNVRNMTIRDDDIILCTYAKCGTHWTWEILHMLNKGAAERSTKDKGTLMLEFAHIPVVDEIPSPRILNTHLPVHMLPRGILEKKKKMVFVYRNAKDVAISAYHFLMKTAEMMGCTIDSLEKFKEEFANKGCIPYDFFKYQREFDEFITENPDFPAFILSYEELTHEPLKHVRRLAKFLGKDYSDTLLEEIINACSFDNMKKAALGDFKEPSFGKKASGKAAIYRKGKVGDWKNNFTVAESEMYDAVIDKGLANVRNLRFQYV